MDDHGAGRAETTHGRGVAAPTLAVIGAGPKATAIAAKAAALRGAGLAPPRLVFLDKGGVAAHWTGADGYTDGAQSLVADHENLALRHS